MGDQYVHETNPHPAGILPARVAAVIPATLGTGSEHEPGDLELARAL